MSERDAYQLMRIGYFEFWRWLIGFNELTSFQLENPERTQKTAQLVLSAKIKTLSLKYAPAAASLVILKLEQKEGEWTGCKVFAFQASPAASLWSSLISAPLYISSANLHNLKHWRGPKKNKVTNKIRAILFVPVVQRRLFLQECLRSLRGFEARFISVIFLRELNQQCISLHI